MSQLATVPVTVLRQDHCHPDLGAFVLRILAGLRCQGKLSQAHPVPFLRVPGPATSLFGQALSVVPLLGPVSTMSSIQYGESIKSQDTCRVLALDDDA
jgi:hypothetical protein